jgi:SAM-dependent methyltransferase
MMLSSQPHRLPQQQLNAKHPPKSQEEVTKEWDGLAGDWDDLAIAASTTSMSSLAKMANPNAELFRRCVRPALQQLVGKRDEKRGEKGRRNSSPSGSRRPSLDERAGDDGASTEQAAAPDDGDGGVGVDPSTAVSSSSCTSNQIKRKVRIVDFGCGTGIMIQHIMRWWHQHQQEQQQEEPGGDRNNSNSNDKDNRPIELEILGIDASSHMVEMLRDKVQSCEWDGAVTPLCCVVAQLPPLVLSHPRENNEVEDDPCSCNNNSSNSKCKVSNNMNDTSSYELLQTWVGTADVVVACCALGCVPDDDLDVTVTQLVALLRPHGHGQLVHCEWWEDESVAATTEDDGGEEGTADVPPRSPREQAGSNGATGPDETRGRCGYGRIPGAKGMTVCRAREIHATRTSVGALESVSVDVVRYGASNQDDATAGLLLGVARTTDAAPPAPTSDTPEEKQRAGGGGASKELKALAKRNGAVSHLWKRTALSYPSNRRFLRNDFHSHLVPVGRMGPVRFAGYSALLAFTGSARVLREARTSLLPGP